MKKILAIAMALVMMMAICVPAFAAVTGGSNAGNDTIISTDTLKDEKAALREKVLTLESELRSRPVAKES